MTTGMSALWACQVMWRSIAMTFTASPTPFSFWVTGRTRASTLAKFTGDWCRTGDLASRDSPGLLWYQGRSDDVFKAAGYRIGPGEIENCLVKHPAVANVAVVPKPDARAARWSRPMWCCRQIFWLLAHGYAGTGRNLRLNLWRNCKTTSGTSWRPTSTRKRSSFWIPCP